MSGKNTDVSSRIAAEFNLAFYFHCQAHQLNLCIMNACKLTQVHNILNKVRIMLFLTSRSVGTFCYRGYTR